jgi:hypothetical protein
LPFLLHSKNQVGLRGLLWEINQLCRRFWDSLSPSLSPSLSSWHIKQKINPSCTTFV